MWVDNCGGGQRVCWPPPLKLLGGAGPLPPPPLSSYAYAKIDEAHKSKERKMFPNSAPITFIYSQTGNLSCYLNIETLLFH